MDLPPGVDSIEPPDDTEDTVLVTLIQSSGGVKHQHRLNYSAAVQLVRAFRHFKLTKRGRIVGIVTSGSYYAFDLLEFCEIEVKVRNSKRFAKAIEE